MAGGLAPAVYSMHNISGSPMTCAGFDEHIDALQQDMSSLIHAADYAVSRMESARTIDEKAAGKVEAWCAMSSVEQAQSRLSACDHIMDELAVVGWGPSQLKSLASLKSKQNSLGRLFSSAFGTQICGSDCVGLDEFLVSVEGEYHSLIDEMSVASRLASSALHDGKSEEMTSKSAKSRCDLYGRR